MSNNTDESVSQFLSITGSVDVNQAMSYLEMAGNDLETAISLFLEHSSSGINTTTTTTTTATATGDGTGVDHSNTTHFGYNGDQVRAPDQTRRMRLMDYEEPSVGIPMGMFMDPFAMTSSSSSDPFRSMGFGGTGRGMNAFQTFQDSTAADHHHHDYSSDPFGNEEMTQNPTNLNYDTNMNIRDLMNRVAAQEEGNYNNDDDDDNHDDARNGTHLYNATTNTNTTTSTTTRSLANLFQPPIHLIHTAGGFQGAKNVAKDTRRWLLVNLQSDEEFACHALNRDVWRDELVENLIREGFVFWQTDNTSSEGQIYAQRYKVHAYPHIGIIDPRTGRLMFRKEGWTQVNPLRPEQFAELAADFCSRHSFDKAPIAPLSSHVPTTTNSGNRSSNMFQNPDNMTEEEQLQAALQASMGDTMVQEQNQQDAYDSDDSDVYILENDDDSVVDHPHDTNVSMDSSLKLPSKTTDTTSAPPSSSPQKTLSFWDDILSIKVEEEPSATNNVARIMIRMPDGKRLVRKFDNHGTVKDIYAFVAQSYPDFKSRNKEFEMMVGFPPKDLMTCVDESIASAGLAGESITVRWKD